MHDSATERVLARYMLEPRGRAKTAAFPPVPNEDGGNESGASKRLIPKDHEFQAKSLKPLSKALWASTVALGHALTAYRHLSRLKSATVSPDGLMGGRGYVMKLTEMRQKLYEASEALSAISDTIFDEINGPHWKPKLAQLDEADKEDVTRFIDEAQEVMDDPEAGAEEEIEEIEGKSKGKSKREPEGGPEDDSSSLPGSGEFQGESTVQSDPTPRTKEASWRKRPPGMSDRAWIHEFYTDPTRPGYVAPTPPPSALQKAIYIKTANSSLPVSELSGGPRVDHIGPGTGMGEYGDFSEAETLSPPADEWTADGAGLSRRDDQGEDYEYTSGWENETPSATACWNDPGDDRDTYLMGDRKLLAATNVPDSNTDDTPTEAWDFGIGYGARGQGAGGYGNPSGEGFADGVGGKGVWGPHSGLPSTPSQSTGDSTHLVLDEATNRHAAQQALYGKLPEDVAGEVARSDYYPGAKDNTVSVGMSEIPAPDDTGSEGGARDLMNTYYTRTDTQTDYERFDYTTHTLREPGGSYPGQDHQEPFAPDGEATR